MNTNDPDNPPVIMRRSHVCMSIILNRKEVLNSLNLAMVRLITKYLSGALTDDNCKLVLFYGLGDKAFCAGGDIRHVAWCIQNNMDEADQFFQEEYALDLMIHQFPKPVIVIADGITMGGGLGIASGADWVIATEKTRMAMPETRIGFFPDVGATGWMFGKCPTGYPEYLGLTSFEMKGGECVRLGFATHLADSKNIHNLIKTIETFQADGILTSKELLPLLMRRVGMYINRNIEPKPDADQWVAEYFAGQSSLPEIIESLNTCSIHLSPCDGILTGLSERSPTALVLTLKLLRHNEHLTMDKVYEADSRAMKFIIRQQDFLEGVRARLIDRDNQPKWQPDSIDQVDLSALIL